MVKYRILTVLMVLVIVICSGLGLGAVAFSISHDVVHAATVHSGHYFNVDLFLETASQGIDEDGLFFLIFEWAEGKDCFLQAMSPDGSEYILAVGSEDFVNVLYSSYEYGYDLFDVAYVKKGWNPDYIDFSTGELLFNVPSVSFIDENYVANSPFEIKSDMGGEVVEFPPETVITRSFFSAVGEFMLSLKDISVDIFSLLYLDGKFTDIGICFIFFGGVSLALILFMFVIQLWRVG